MSKSSKLTVEKTVVTDICKAIDERGKTMLTVCKALHDLAKTADVHLNKPVVEHENS